jgi:hypothetical protein
MIRAVAALIAAACVPVTLAGCSNATKVAAQSFRSGWAMNHCRHLMDGWTSYSLGDPFWREKVRKDDDDAIACLRKHGMQGNITGSYVISGGRVRPQVNWRYEASD